VLYATTLCSSSSKNFLEAALANFLELAENGGGKLLYSVYYEQQQEVRTSGEEHKLSQASLDLAFNDEMLEDVERKWKMSVAGGEEQPPLMQFEERPGMNDEDNDNDNAY
jgi:hypothetical protein